MKKNNLIVTAFIFITIACTEPVKKIACTGDSITAGYGLTNPKISGYPAVLNEILGSDYKVLNSGKNATYLQKNTENSYWNTKEFSKVFKFKPNSIIIMLGTNDTKSYIWNAGNFEKDYQALIDTFNSIPTKPKIYLCLPVPAFKTMWDINDSTLEHGVIPIIKKLGKNNNLPVIDLYEKMNNQKVNFPDGIHPNEKAVKMMTEFIAEKINN